MVEITIYVHNWIFPKVISNMTRKNVWCGNKPSINHLHVFGFVWFVHVWKEIKSKLNLKGVKLYIFIGYIEESKGHKLYKLVSQYVITSCDVIFVEFVYFNGEIIVSSLDFGFLKMILDHELKMEVGKSMVK